MFATARPKRAVFAFLNILARVDFDPAAVWPGIAYQFTDGTDLPNDCADKSIVCVSSLTKIAQIAAALPRELYVELSEGRLGLIMHRSAKKWNAIRRLADHFSVSPAETAAFGDDYNDIEMLKNRGVGVAVANALDEATAAADFVCASHDEDDVAAWLAENVL
ncbi:MAG: HAD hydrolase family protein [Oscillospiraceae bacterium]|nr:HAD hydrolase family protein [Oscillospiraceae bacterium]